ncbi:hypothetical protein [Trichodesmium erythraeum]
MDQQNGVTIAIASVSYRSMGNLLPQALINFLIVNHIISGNIVSV